MKKKLQYVIIFLTIFTFNINFVNAEFSTNRVMQVCGFNYMPDRLPGFTSGIYTILKILVPIILIVMGMLDFTKATMASKEDDMKKSQKRFITRLIAGVMVFFVMSIVQFVFKKIDDSSAFTNCMNCILSNSGCGASNLMEPNTVCDNRSLETCNGTDKYGSTCVQVNTGSKPICRSQCNSITDSNRCNAKSYCTWYNNSCIGKSAPSYFVTVASNSSGASGGGGSSGTSSTTTTDTKEVERKKIVNYAKKYATAEPNHPYVYGGTSLCKKTPYKRSNGCQVDCSGFVQQVYLHNNYTCSGDWRTTTQQANTLNAKKYKKESDLKVGDLLFFYPGISHVGIYIGNGKYVHASSERTGVIITPLNGHTPVKYASIIGNSKCKKSK